MNWQIVGGAAAIAIVAGVLGAVGWSLASDDDADDDDQLALESTPTDTAQPSNGQDSDLPQAELLSAVDIPEDLSEAAAQRVEEYPGDYEAIGYVALIDNDGQMVLAVLGQDFQVAATATQRIFYFVDGEYQGTDWEVPVISVASIRALDNGQLEVTYNVYEPGDERCCPDGGTFVWFAAFDGTAENPEDPPQGIFTN